MRRLLSIRRHVPLDIVDDYLAAWGTVRDGVEARGGHAWIFRGSGHEDQFLEFIEWSDEQPAPLADADVSAAFSQLAAYAEPSTPEDWEQAT